VIHPDVAAMWNTAVPDWENRLVEGRSLIPELPLYDEVAEKALRIFKRLRVPDLHGTPTYGDVCGEWVFDLVRAIFGSYDPETKIRALREFFLLVPKKNGKSAIAAAIILTAAIMNERPEAECLLIAPTQKIAGIAFKQIRGMIALDSYLSKTFHIQLAQKAITHRDTGAVIMILSADGEIVTGSKGTYILIDETHVLGAKKLAPEVFLELRGGLASREDGFMLQITTQSKAPPRGQFKKELQLARDVRDGKSDYPMLAVLYELPEAMQRNESWRKEDTWGLVNPNLGRSVSLRFLRDGFAKAEGKDALALMASQHLNVEIGMGYKGDGWAGSEFWVGNNDNTLTFERLLDRSEVAVIGIDWGGMWDLASLAVIGREAGSRDWLTWVHAWCTESMIKKQSQIEPELRDFEEDGDLTITETAEEHVAGAIAYCERVRTAGLLPEKNAVGADPWGVTGVFDGLAELGYTEHQLTGVGQGFRLTGAITGLERRLYDGRLTHNQPILDWAVSNAKPERRGNGILITKETAGAEKVDPLIAHIIGAFLMDLNPTVRSASYLEAMDMAVL